MDEKLKKVLLVVVIVCAIGVAIVTGKGVFGEQPLEKGVTHPSPPKSMAQMEREATQRELAGRQSQVTGDVPTGQKGKSSDGP